MKTTYEFAVNGDTMTIRADFAQASSPIEYMNHNGNWDTTPLQVADAKHDFRRAAVLVNQWHHQQGGAMWAPGQTVGIKVRRLRSA